MVAAPGDQKWVFPTGGAVVSCPAIGDDGTIYFGSADTNVYAVDGATGRSRWTFPTGGAIKSSAAIGADGTVYIGSSDHKFYALDGGTGVKKWEFVTGGALTSPSIGTKGTVYVASGDHQIYGLDGVTGGNLWRLDIGTSPYTASPPDALAVGVDNTVYYVQDQSMVALNGDTGALLWQKTHSDLYYRTVLPAIDEFGRVCMATAPAPALEFLDGRTGQVAWSSDYWGAVYGMPILGREGMIYMSQSGRSFDNNCSLTAYNTRTRKSGWILPGVQLATPVLGADGTLYGSIGPTVLALDSATGRTNWQFQAAGWLKNSLTLGRDGTVYFSAANGVCALEGTSVGGLADTAWPKLNHDARNTGCLPLSNNHAPVLPVPGTQVIDELTTLTVTNVATDPDLPANTLSFELVSPPPGAAIEPLTGVFTWTPAEAQGPGTNTVTVQVTDSGVPRLTTTGSFMVIVHEVNTPPTLEEVAGVPRHITVALTLQLHATDPDLPVQSLTFALDPGAPEGMTLDPQTGILQWDPAPGQRPSTNLISVRAADGMGGTDQKRFTVVAESLGSKPAAGEVIWTNPALKNAGTGVAVGGDGTVYFGGSDAKVHALDGATGTEKWAFQAGDDFWSAPTVATDGTVYIVSADHRLYALAGDSGQKKWESPIGDSLSGSPTLGVDGTVYVGVGTLYALDAATGGRRWVLPLPGRDSLAADAEGTVYCGADRLYALNGGSGQTNWSFPVSSATVALGQDGVIYAAADQVYALDCHSGIPRWTYQAKPAFLSYPVVTRDGTVIVSCSAQPWDAAHPQASFIALDEITGREKWKSPDLGPVLAWPALGDDGTLYAPQRGRLLALDASTGLKQWEFRAANYWAGMAAIGPGGLVCFIGDALWAVRGNGTGGLADSPWPKFHGNARSSGNPADDQVRVLDRVSRTVNVRTRAGVGVAGFADGPGPTCFLNGPGGCCTAATGRTYVADTGNHRIRLVDTSRWVTTLAGTGIAGHQDGPAATAQFAGPSGICADAQGNVFVTETNQFIRRIGADGIVSTLAGTGVAGYRDGPAASAQFHTPHAIAVDESGNLWITDFNNHALRKLSPEGTVSTWAGNGVAGSSDGTLAVAQFNQPAGLAFDRAGNLYVSEWGGQRLRRVGTDGQVSTVAGDGRVGYLDGPGLRARFNHPDGLVVDPDGNVVVADSHNETIRQLTPAGQVQTLAGSSATGVDDGDGATATFRVPSGIGCDGRGRIYVADRGNNALRRLEGPIILPTINPIPDQVIDPLQTLTLTASGATSDAENEPLHFTLDSGAPPGTTIDTVSGILTWTPTLAQGAATYPINVWVVDSQWPPSVAITHFTVVVNKVNPVNTAPVLTVPSNQSVDELTTLRVTNTAPDPDIPANTLTFGLVTAPDGVRLDAATGVLTWTPTEAQGPSTNRITVRVTDNGVPPLSATNSFTVVVNEVNAAPVLTTAIRNYTVTAGATLVFTNTAIDSDIPTNSLTYVLDLGAPSGAVIERNTGVFTWTATGSPATNQFKIWVTDDGVPYRSGFGEFTVVTLPKPRDLQFGGIQREAGGRIAITWAAKPGAHYQLQYKNRLDEANWMGRGDPQTATSETLSLTETVDTEGQRFYRVMRLAD